MDMEFEIQGLRQQLTQKTVELIHTRKEVCMSFRVQGLRSVSMPHSQFQKALFT
jgi:hypothetical protein